MEKTEGQKEKGKGQMGNERGGRHREGQNKRQKGGGGREGQKGRGQRVTERGQKGTAKEGMEAE